MGRLTRTSPTPASTRPPGMTPPPGATTTPSSSRETTRTSSHPSRTLQTFFRTDAEIRGKSKSIFEVRTKKLGQLPLVDFYPVDYGKPHQAFGFEVGPVCFR